MAPPLRIAIAGLGTVGRGVCELLTTNQKLLAIRCGREVQMVAQSDILKRDDVPRGSARFFSNALEMVDKVEADVVS
jgi:homoserine dehydrogenase